VFSYFACTQHNFFWLLCASLEVSFPSAFAVTGVRFFRVCLTRHAPLLRFFAPSVVYSSCYLSGLFHPVALLGFSFRAFSSKRSASSFEGPYPLAVDRFALCKARSSGHPGKLRPRVCGSASGSFSLLELVLIDLVFSRLYSRCSPGFLAPLQGISFFVLRTPHKDLRGCDISITSSALLRFGALLAGLRFLRFVVSVCFARGSSPRSLPLRSLRRSPPVRFAARLPSYDAPYFSVVGTLT
jgi:hypothetical protein